jgi:predicted flap endonuclease-1-like 5' DNA nuclease
MSSFACCIWWLLFGVLLGLLLSWLLSKLGREETPPPAARVAAPAMAAVSTTMVDGIDMVAAARAGFNVRGADDLKIVEGIGPKIDAVLKENGIRTFKDLAASSVPTLSAILDKAGPRFKLANPGTWAEQARMCANNQWDALKKYQDELTAGVALSDDDKA